MDIERLKELVQAEDSDLWDYKVELIGLLDEAIAHQSVTEMAVCPNCNGSGVYQEYDEYDRYYLHTCGTCDGSGEVDRQQESED